MNRRTLPSRPDLEQHRAPHAPDVYEILAEHHDRLGGLEGLAQEGKIADAQILSEVRGLAATDRHATTKLISALVVTVITTIGGVIGTIAAMRPGAPPAAPARSALDISLDTCRAMQPGSPGREECTTRAIAEHP